MPCFDEDFQSFSENIFDEFLDSIDIEPLGKIKSTVNSRASAPCIDKYRIPMRYIVSISYQLVQGALARENTVNY